MFTLRLNYIVSRKVCDAFAVKLPCLGGSGHSSGTDGDGTKLISCKRVCSPSG